jgi:hypothetical protein
MNAAPASPLRATKELLTIPTLWVMLTLPGRPGTSCRSPFREDRHPSFSIYDHGRKWRDHATGQGGDAVDFLALALGIQSEEACRKLIELAGTTSRPSEYHLNREKRSAPQIRGDEDRWNCSLESLKRWEKAGILRPLKIGCNVRYRLSDVIEAGREAEIA